MAVPEQEPTQVPEDLLAQALANRPDLKQGALQVTNAEIYLKGSRNELLPELDIVGTAQSSSLAGPFTDRVRAGALRRQMSFLTLL